MERPSSMLDGLLLVDKPSRVSSFGVVAKVRGILRATTGIKKPKVGHTGTLDPLATGLMVVVIGSYCKRAQEFSKLDKAYDVELTLGAVTSTGDSEGEVVPVSDDQPAKADVGRVVESYVGTIEQVPPVYSAIKVNGQRAYKLARAGKEVVMEPRTVTIRSIEKVEYSYPKITFVAHVSSGTYIRSLVSDIGRDLGVGAYMSGLRRTHVGALDLGSAIRLKDMDYAAIAAALQN